MALKALGWLSKPSVLLSHLRVSNQNWIIYAVLIAATCLVGWCYNGFIQNLSRDTPTLVSPGAKKPSPSPTIPRSSSFNDSFARIRRHFTLNGATSMLRAMRYQSEVQFGQRAMFSTVISPPPPSPPRRFLKSKQLIDVFLVLDVEATCDAGSDFHFPNEIIEFPVCLMRWKDKKGSNMMASKMEVDEEFRSFVKPTWRPNLSEFCTRLTGITQSEVDSAPTFPEVIEMFQAFLIKHGVLDAETLKPLVRFCWCSDGPYDVRDFVVKQCFLSKVPMPVWMTGDIFDVRAATMKWYHAQRPEPAKPTRIGHSKVRSLNILSQLKALELPPFEGRQHSGIDDTRNIARIVAELARRGISLSPNTVIHTNRRWPWMGKNGQVLEEYIST